MLIVMAGKRSRRHRVVESIDEYHHRTACGRVLDGPTADRAQFPPNCRSCHLALD